MLVEQDAKHDANSEIYTVYQVSEVTVEDQSNSVTALTVAVVILSVLLTLTCCYVLLKNRGKLCRKK